MTRSKKALVIIDNDTLEDRDGDLAARLTDELGFDVNRVELRNLSDAEPERSDLIIVCSSRAPSVLRNLAVPIVVCNPEALYDLGMTFGKPNEDYGTAKYETINVEPLLSHPVVAGLAGPQKVTEGVQVRGWAKPGAEAVVAASIGGNQNRAVVFGYEGASTMPTIEAAHRRIAFLISGGESHDLTKRGWDLFEAATDWAVNGGRVATGVRTAESARVLPGDESVRLSGDQFLDWRDERVAKRVFRRLGTIFSVLGVGGLIAGGTLIYGGVSKAEKELSDKITRAVTEKVKSEVDSELRTKFKEDLPKEIAHSIMGVGKLEAKLDEKAASKIIELEKDLQTKASEAANDMAVKMAVQLETRMNKEFAPRLSELLNQMGEAANRTASDAVEKKMEEGGFEEVIYSKVRDVVLNSRGDTQSRRDRRAQALRLMTFFVTNEDDFRTDLLQVIEKTSAEEHQLLELALNAYEPESVGENTIRADDSDQNIQILKAIKPHLYRDFSQGASDTQSVSVLAASYAGFLSRFPAKYAPELAQWIWEKPNHRASGVVVEGLSNMDGEAAVQELGKMAFAPGRRFLNYLGRRGLSTLKFDIEISDETRHQFLDRLIESLGEKQGIEVSGEDRSELAAHASELFRAIMNFNNSTIRSLRLRARGFRNPELDNIYQRIEEGRLYQLREEFATESDIVKRIVQKAATREVPLDKAIVNLLRPSDWEVVVLKHISTGKTGSGVTEPVNTLLYSWIERLELERKTNGLDSGDRHRHALDLLERSLAFKDALHFEGPVRAIEFAIRYGTDFEAESFLQAFQNQEDAVLGTTTRGMDSFKGQRPLAAAIEKAPLNATRRVLKFIVEEKKRDLYETVCLSLKGAPSDKEINQFLTTVVKDELASFDAVLAAVDTLGHVRVPSSEAQVEAADALLVRLKRLDSADSFASKAGKVLAAAVLTSSNAPAAVPVAESDVDPQVLITVIIDTLDRFCTAAAAEDVGDPCPVLAKIATQITEGAKTQRTVVQTQLARLVTQHYFLMANSFLELERYSDVIQVADELIKLNPSDPEPHWIRGTALRKNKQYEEAIKAFQSLAAIDVKDPRANLEIALVHVLTRDEEAAVKYTAMSVASFDDPEMKAGAQENLGLLYLRKGDFSKALKNTEIVRNLREGRPPDAPATARQAEPMAWNSLIRAIALKQLDQDDSEAFEDWVKVGVKRGLSDLKEFIPKELIEPYEKRSAAAHEKFQ